MSTGIFSSKINDLINALNCLPGVGRKTAQRMAIYLLDKNQEGARSIVKDLDKALSVIKRCSKCQMLSEESECLICSDASRELNKICIVETMLDFIAIENTSVYKGKYFILHGKISPLDGISPEQLKLDKLKSLVDSNKIKEVVIALGFSPEAETTAHFIVDLLKDFDCKISRIGFGIPCGGDLEYLDQQTLSYALNSRTNF